jgi:hypothetical protein
VFMSGLDLSNWQTNMSSEPDPGSQSRQPQQFAVLQVQHGELPTGSQPASQRQLSEAACLRPELRLKLRLRSADRVLTAGGTYFSRACPRSSKVSWTKPVSQSRRSNGSLP